MDELRFEWDERKARENLAKHKVSFEEARTVFFDDRAVEFYDDEHSDWEDRFLLLGISARLRILIVCYCLRDEGFRHPHHFGTRATKSESKFYPEGEE